MDVERATNDVRNAVGSIRASLPQDVLDPIVQRIDITGGGTLLNDVVSSPTMDPEQLSWFVEDTVAKKVMGQRWSLPLDRGAPFVDGSREPVCHIHW